MADILGERILADPEPTVDTTAYWAAANRGQLLFGRCKACGETHFYPRTRCPRCLAADTELVEASGSGTLYSYSVMRRAKVPYAIAYVTLEEGVTMMTNIVGCGPDELKIGMKLRVEFQPSASGQKVPMFRPA